MLAFDYVYQPREDDEETPEVKPELDAEGNPIEQSEEVRVAAAAAAKNKQSQLDLEIFSEEELEEMDRDVLIADVANLEGSSGRVAFVRFSKG